MARPAKLPVVDIAVNLRLLALFRERRVFHRRHNGERWKVGDHLLVTPGCRIEPYAHIFGGNEIPLAMGAFSYTQGRAAVPFELGRYCSISDGLTATGEAHPTDWALTSSVFYAADPIQGLRRYLVEDRGQTSFALLDFDSGPATVTVGNDVWIGLGVAVKNGVTIGDGAIIGARALVTKDVPPYAVVAGVPARVIRMRFPDDLVQRFLAVQPWRFGPDDLRPLGMDDPQRFLDQLETKIALTQLKPLAFEPLTGAEILAAATET